MIGGKPAKLLQIELEIPLFEGFKSFAAQRGESMRQMGTRYIREGMARDKERDKKRGTATK